MRLPVLPAVALLAGCSTATVDAPSLAPRAAEAIDPRVPVAEPVLAGDPDAQLVERLEDLVAQAIAADEEFEAAAAEARRLVAVAGPPESESWVVAQQALSVAVAARWPVVRAVSDIDQMGAERIVSAGGIGAANFQAIQAAAARVAEIDEREAEAVSAMQAALRR